MPPLAARFKMGDAQINAVLRLRPDDAEGYNNRGIAYFMQGNKELGCLDAQKACALGNCKSLEVAKSKGLCRMRSTFY